MLYRGDDARRLARLAAIAGEAGVPLIAVNDVLYHAPERRALAGRRHLHPRARHAGGGRPQARSQRRAPSQIGGGNGAAVSQGAGGDGRDRCASSKAAGSRSRNCATPNTPTRRAPAMPRRRRRWSPLPRPDCNGAFPTARRRRSATRSIEELRVIGELGYAPFFLTVDEIVKFARSVDAADPVPGPRLGGQFGDLLLPRHHRRVAG